jgi:hypothetical protein
VLDVRSFTLPEVEVDGQFEIGKTEWAFGVTPLAVWAACAVQRPDVALAFGPLPPALDALEWPDVLVDDEAPVGWDVDLPRDSAWALLFPGTEIPIFANTSDAVLCAAPGSDPVAAAALPAPNRTTEAAAAAAFTVRAFEIIFFPRVSSAIDTRCPSTAACMAATSASSLFDRPVTPIVPAGPRSSTTPA